MNIPNIEKKTFREMTAEERGGIVEDFETGKVEVWNWATGGWQNTSECLLSFSCVYRIKSRKLQIPWEHIKPEYKWAAMDESENIYFYSKPPVTSENYWISTGELSCKSALSIDTAGVDWQNSLVERPENV